MGRGCPSPVGSLGTRPATRRSTFAARWELRSRGSALRCPICSPTAPPPGASPSQGCYPAGMRLLLAEDERRVRAFVARGLSEEGYEVRESGDGLEARTLLETDRFDLLLLDWMLPALSGLDLLRSMRARQDITPVIMLTARDAVSDRTAALNAGADDYLVKPFAFDELLARVRAVLRRAAGRASGILKYEDLTLDPVTRRV